MPTIWEDKMKGTTVVGIICIIVGITSIVGGILWFAISPARRGVGYDEEICVVTDMNIFQVPCKQLEENCVRYDIEIIFTINGNVEVSHTTVCDETVSECVEKTTSNVQIGSIIKCWYNPALINNKSKQLLLSQPGPKPWEWAVFVISILVTGLVLCFIGICVAAFSRNSA